MAGSRIRSVKPPHNAAFANARIRPRRLPSSQIAASARPRAPHPSHDQPGPARATSGGRRAKNAADRARMTTRRARSSRPRPPRHGRGGRAARRRRPPAGSAPARAAARRPRSRPRTRSRGASAAAQGTQARSRAMRMGGPPKPVSIRPHSLAMVARQTCLGLGWAGGTGVALHGHRGWRTPPNRPCGRGPHDYRKSPVRAMAWCGPPRETCPAQARQPSGAGGAPP